MEFKTKQNKLNLINEQCNHTEENKKLTHAILNTVFELHILKLKTKRTKQILNFNQECSFWQSYRLAILKLLSIIPGLSK